MRPSKYKELILEILSELEPDPPPHSSSCILNRLNDCAEYGYLEEVPSKAQINRLLNNMWKDGTIVANRVKVSDFGWCQPYWQREFQLSDHIVRNWMITESNRLHRKADRAKYGVSIFGGEPFDYGLLPDEVIQLEKEIRSMMQKSHPDKQAGYESEFQLMVEALSWVKDGIPLPDSPPPEPLMTDNKKQLVY